MIYIELFRNLQDRHIRILVRRMEKPAWAKVGDVGLSPISAVDQNVRRLILEYPQLHASRSRNRHDAVQESGCSEPIRKIPSRSGLRTPCPAHPDERLPLQRRHT